MNNFYISGLGHVGIPVSNLENSVLFYTDLGFSKKYQPEGRRCVFMENGNLLLELYERDETAKIDGAINHIAVNCENVVEAYKTVLEKHIPVVSNAIQYLPFWGTGVSFFTITGPDNERIEFSQKGNHNL